MKTNEITVQSLYIALYRLWKGAYCWSFQRRNEPALTLETLLSTGNCVIVQITNEEKGTIAFHSGWLEQPGKETENWKYACCKVANITECVEEWCSYYMGYWSRAVRRKLLFELANIQQRKLQVIEITFWSLGKFSSFQTNLYLFDHFSYSG